MRQEYVGRDGEKWFLLRSSYSCRSFMVRHGGGLKADRVKLKLPLGAFPSTRSSPNRDPQKYLSKKPGSSVPRSRINRLGHEQHGSGAGIGAFGDYGGKKLNFRTTLTPPSLLRSRGRKLSHSGNSPFPFARSLTSGVTVWGK